VSVTFSNPRKHAISNPRLLHQDDRRQTQRRRLFTFTMSLVIALVGLLAALPSATPVAANGGSALRFFGTGPGDSDRVKIPLGPLTNGQISSSFPVNVAGDFTVEFWMRAEPGTNEAPDCSANGWYYGNIMLDRDVDGAGDYGDYGVALCDGRIAFGVSAGEDDRLATGATQVTDGEWRHIAVTRADGGQLAIFVDGRLDGQAAGPAGRIDYRTDRATEQPNSDPYLVLGAEKHDYEGSYYYNGWLDDLRLSDTVRYTADFARPTAPHPADDVTVALYRFDEGAGTQIADSSSGSSNGELIPRSGAVAEHWSPDTPFQIEPAPTSEPTPESATESPEAEPTVEPGSVEPTAEPEGVEPTAEGIEPTLEPEVAEPMPEPASVATETPAALTPTPDDGPTEPTPTAEPQGSIAITDTNVSPPSAGQHYGPPPPAGVFTPLTWALVIVGLGLLISLATVLIWRRRA
jgi:hypothetical protein